MTNPKQWLSLGYQEEGDLMEASEVLISLFLKLGIVYGGLSF